MWRQQAINVPSLNKPRRFFVTGSGKARLEGDGNEERRHSAAFEQVRGPQGAPAATRARKSGLVRWRGSARSRRVGVPPTRFFGEVQVCWENCSATLVSTFPPKKTFREIIPQELEMVAMCFFDVALSHVLKGGCLRGDFEDGWLGRRRGEVG